MPEGSRLKGSWVAVVDVVDVTSGRLVMVKLGRVCRKRHRAGSACF